MVIGHVTRLDVQAAVAVDGDGAVGSSREHDLISARCCPEDYRLWLAGGSAGQGDL